MATKKKELLEQDTPVTETVMSVSYTHLGIQSQPSGKGSDHYRPPRAA